jgi:hypothetical protein
MTIDEMLIFCEKEEQNHRIRCKRDDDASGYTRSKDKNIRTASAIREEIYGNYYKQIADIMRKYQKIQTRLDGLEHSMECLLESDPRTFADRECENGWLFDKIIEWRKVINEVLKDDNSNLDNSSM